jgi:hypothetical protein
MKEHPVPPKEVRAVFLISAARLRITIVIPDPAMIISGFQDAKEKISFFLSCLLIMVLNYRRYIHIRLKK